MVHESPLIAILVFGFGLAFIFGTVANRLKLSPLVGYVLAGVAIGPFTPGFVADSGLTLQLAEVGVILLMFGVGLHFSPKDLMSVRGIAIPGALLQVSVIIALGVGVALWLGWPPASGIVFGLALCVASTVVTMRALQERRLMETARGHTVVGWLVVQDLLTVLALVLLPPLAGVMKGGAAPDFGALGLSLAFTFGKLALFAALMFVVGRRLVPWILHYIAHTGSRELFRLAVLAVALGVAFGAAALFGVSIALGAFFAGMILSESPLSQRAAEESLPLRDAFAVLFFVSVGVLFDPATLIRDPIALALTIVVVLAGGGCAALFARLFGLSWTTGFLVGASVAQIGEFSFILADLGIGLGLIPERARDLILGTSIVTILINPFLLNFAQRLRAREHPALPEPEEKPEELVPTAMSGHAVLVGYGRVGRLIAEGLLADGMPLLVVEDANDAVESLREAGIEHLQGNAASDPVLAATNLAQARILFVAIPAAFEAGQIVEQARRARPDLEIVARAHFDAEVEHLRNMGANSVVMGEREIAQAMLAYARAAPSAA